MRRLIRRAFNSAAAVSAVLSVATVVLWVRSYSHYEWAAYQRRDRRTYTATSRLGAAVFDITDGWPPGTVADPFRVRSDPLYVKSLPPPSRWHLLGLGFDRATQPIGMSIAAGTLVWSGTATSASLVVPYWFLFLLTAAAPVLRAGALYRRRVLPGHCAVCGYDLRATPDRCPECGAVRPAGVRLLHDLDCGDIGHEGGRNGWRGPLRLWFW